MRPIRVAWAGCILLLVTLWWLADPLPWQGQPFIVLRNAVVNGTGVLAVGVMAVALVLAARPMLLEPVLGGLDKMYRLHKWLGITSLVMAVLHWVATQSPGWLVGLGWLQRAQRERPPPPDGALLLWLQSQRGLAEELGEIAFYAAVVLIALALFKRFPYRFFFSTHRLLALAFLVLVFHSLVLMPAAYWGEWLGPVMALLMAGGSAAAIVLLFRRAGHRRQAYGTVEQITRHDTMQVLEVRLQLKSRWVGHAAGQFVFVRFDGDAEPHPFTLSSAWTGDGSLLLLIKGLGDYTSALPARLHRGDLVRVEGPYGQFNFRKNARRPSSGQIWIGGGIGITPFIARMKHLALHPETGVVDLFHPVGHLDADAAGKLALDAQAAGVQLHVTRDDRDGLLTGARLRAAVPDWIGRDVWFCGPPGLGTALRRDLLTQGLPAAAFHQELFSFR